MNNDSTYSGSVKLVPGISPWPKHALQSLNKLWTVCLLVGGTEEVTEACVTCLKPKLSPTQSVISVRVII